MPDGVLVVNKPRGLTSHDVVELARRRLGTKQIGHAGSLDPMAEGVLVLLVGSATKLQQQLQHHRKRYEAVVQFGVQTETGDAWGSTVATAPVPPLDRQSVAELLTSLIGRHEQTPPAFSAVKYHGRPLYWWARRGIRQPAPSRTIELFHLALVELDAETLRYRVDCSGGTYIRTLSETIAHQVGTVGHLRELIRLAVEPWTLADAISLDRLTDASSQTLDAILQPLHVLDARGHRLTRA